MTMKNAEKSPCGQPEVSDVAGLGRWCRFWKEKIIEDMKLKAYNGAELYMFDDAEELVFEAGLYAVRLGASEIANRCLTLSRPSPREAAVLFGELAEWCDGRLDEASPTVDELRELLADETVDASVPTAVNEISDPTPAMNAGQLVNLIWGLDRYRRNLESGKRRVIDWIANGRLPAIKVRRGFYVVSKNALDRLRKAERQTPTA